MLAYSGSGVATFTHNLVKNLLKVDKKNEYHLFYSSLRRPKNFYYLDELQQLGGRIHSVRLPPRILKLIWGKLHIIPIEWFTGKMDFFHTSDFLRPPLLPGTIGITTLHDLTWKLYPQWHTPGIIKAHSLKLQKTLKYEDIIICSSNHTRRDLFKCYPQVNKEKVYVNYLGVGEQYKPIKNSKQIESILQHYHIKTPYLIYVGAIEPRKNLVRLIRAFNLLIKEKEFRHYNLVIGGRAGWKNQQVFSLVKRLKLENKVIFTGFIQDHHLPTLYSAASTACYVSLYEGFGLPPLEAMACGCPVVCSNTSSLPEIMPPNTPLCNPKNVTSIYKTLLNCLSQKSNSNKLVTHTSKYTWSQTAKNFLQIITD